MDFIFCPICGKPLAPLAEGRDAGRPACAACGFVHYDNPAVTTFGLLEREDARFLVMCRAHAPYVGLWDMAGGFVESGETPQDTLLREVAEETGLAVEIDGLVGVYKSVYGPGRHTVDIAFACRVVGGELTISEEKSEARWITPDEIPPMAFDAQSTALSTLVLSRLTPSS
jgi:ADP-ribose pyrophosphatase YjhB (NUDIX family)